MKYTKTEITKALLYDTTSGAILYFGLASDTPEEFWEDEQDAVFADMYAEAVAEGYAGTEEDYQADILKGSGVMPGKLH